MANSKVNYSEIKKGDIFSESSHYVVEGVASNNVVFKHQESGQIVQIEKSYVQNLMSTANQFSKVVEVTKEDKVDGTPGIRTIWENIHSSQVFTVCFKKQDTVKSKKRFNEEVEAKTAQLLESIETARIQKKGVANAAKAAILALAENPITKIIEGEERILKGYKLDFTSRDGKYSCMDMEINDVRPVNINTIKWLVFDGVKYEVK